MKVELKDICKHFGPLKANDDVSLVRRVGHDPRPAGRKRRRQKHADESPGRLHQPGQRRDSSRQRARACYIACRGHRPRRRHALPGSAGLCRPARARQLPAGPAPAGLCPTAAGSPDCASWPGSSISTWTPTNRCEPRHGRTAAAGNPAPAVAGRASAWSSTSRRRPSRPAKGQALYAPCGSWPNRARRSSSSPTSWRRLRSCATRSPCWRAGG